MTDIDRVHAAKTRRQLNRPGRFPITLSNRMVRRILEKQPHVLILPSARRLGKLGTPKLYDIHNALVVKRNTAHREGGRVDLQSDPHVLTIELLEVIPVALGDLQLKDARAAGFATVAELLEDWREHRRRSTPEVEVFLHRFQIEGARYLHRDIHRGYTHDPAEGLRDELAAVSKTDLEDMATVNRTRFESTRVSELNRKQLRSLMMRMKEAGRRGDLVEMAKLRKEIEEWERRVARAA